MTTAWFTVRKFVNRGGYFIAGGVLLLSLIWVWHTFRAGSTGAMPHRAYYIDEQTQAETVQDVSAIPPLIGKGGQPTVVREMKYSCDGGTTRVPYLLIKYTEQAQSELKSLPKDDPAADLQRSKLLADGELVRSPEAGSKWVAATSKEGMKLASPPACPDGKPSNVVYP